MPTWRCTPAEGRCTWQGAVCDVPRDAAVLQIEREGTLMYLAFRPEAQ